MLGTGHFGLVVRNLEKSLSFYQGVLGLELIGVMERAGDDISCIVGLPAVNLRVAFLTLPAAGGATLELIEYVQPRGDPVDTRVCNPGNAHICFQVEDIQAVYEVLKARGVQFKSQPVRIKTGLNRGGWAVYFQDGDGISLELSQRPARDVDRPPEQPWQR